jgi:hypothetical protein
MGLVLSTTGHIQQVHVHERCKFVMDENQCGKVADPDGYCPRHSLLVQVLGSEEEAEAYEFEEREEREKAARKQARKRRIDNA